MADDGAALGLQIFQLVTELRDELPRIPQPQRFAVLKERLKPFPPEIQVIALALIQLGSLLAPDPGSHPPEDALELWREKLAFFYAEEAKTADPQRKFELRKLIEEAKAKIQALDG